MRSIVMLRKPLLCVNHLHWSCWNSFKIPLMLRGKELKVYPRFCMENYLQKVKKIWCAIRLLSYIVSVNHWIDIFLPDIIDVGLFKLICINGLLWLLVLGFADAIIQMSKIDDMMKEDAKNLRDVIDALYVKHKEYAVGIQNYVSGCSEDQSDIKRLEGLWNVSFSFLFKLLQLLWILE